jgi:hypothetical protein
MASKEVVVKEFGPEQAGQRVGWVHANKYEGEHLDLVEVGMAVATVGDDGAVVSYLDYKDGKKCYTSDSIRGFLAATALQVVLPAEDANLNDLSQIDYMSSGPRVFGPSFKVGEVFAGLSPMYSVYTIGDDSLQWAEGDDFATTIKTVMGAHGLAQAYPAVYLALNNSILHADLRPTDDSSTAPVVDREMNTITTTEQSEAALILNRLLTARAVDELSLSRLTMFSGTSAQEGPDRFAEARRTVSKLESEITQSAGRMLFKWGTFLPIGFRPGGRTWPYMDPMVADESVAFGRELEGLRNGDVSTARYELEYELKELDKRYEYAKKGFQVLEALITAEIAVSS